MRRAGSSTLKDPAKIRTIEVKSARDEPKDRALSPPPEKRGPKKRKPLALSALETSIVPRSLRLHMMVVAQHHEILSDRRSAVGGGDPMVDFEAFGRAADAVAGSWTEELISESRSSWKMPGMVRWTPNSVLGAARTFGDAHAADAAERLRHFKSSRAPWSAQAAAALRTRGPSATPMRRRSDRTRSPCRSASRASSPCRPRAPYDERASRHRRG